MAPNALSHGDGAPGAGAEDVIKHTQRTASPAQRDFGGLSPGAAPVVVRLDVVPLPPLSSAPTVAGCRLGGYPAGRDWWGGKRAAGGMSEDHDRCFSMLVLGAFSTGVFQTPMLYPALTLAPTYGANRTS
jgi:hypothetical protein